MCALIAFIVFHHLIYRDINIKINFYGSLWDVAWITKNCNDNKIKYQKIIKSNQKRRTFNYRTAEILQSLIYWSKVYLCAHKLIELIKKKQGIYSFIFCNIQYSCNGSEHENCFPLLFPLLSQQRWQLLRHKLKYRKLNKYYQWSIKNLFVVWISLFSLSPFNSFAVSVCMFDIPIC